MTKRSRRTCYRCDNPASSKEHVPAKAFFPKKASLQLKTVPSCELHNSAKSADDQYVLAHICINAAQGRNLAKRVFLRSIVPHLNQSQGFRKLISDNSQWRSDGICLYPVNLARFDNFFDNLSCALFYIRFGTVFDPQAHNMQHVYLNFRTEDEDEKGRIASAQDMLRYFFDKHRRTIEEYESDYVDEIVYAHKIIAPLEAHGSITIAHSFYGVFEVVSLITKTAICLRT